MSISRQFDIPLSNQLFFSLPNDVRGKVNSEDYVYFKWDDADESYNYDIAVQSFSGEILKFTPLKYRVKLPHVIYSEDTLFFLIPKFNKQLPLYIGTLKRGKRYDINKKSPYSYNLYLI